MTKLEFKKFLNDYKEVSKIGKEIMKEKFPTFNTDDLGVCIHSGKIFFLADDGMTKLDITKEVLLRLMPDNFIF